MLKFLVVWALLEVLIWMVVAGPYMIVHGWWSIPKYRMWTVLCIQLWVAVLPWVIGVWVLLLMPGMRILGTVLLGVWYAQWAAIRWLQHTPLAAVDRDRAFFLFFLVVGCAVINFYLLCHIYWGLTLSAGG